MEDFKKRLKRRIILLSGVLLFILGLGAYGVFKIANTKEGTMLEGAVDGFRFGILLGIGVLTLVHIIRYIRATKYDTTLKLLYNQEHDERLKLIRSKAGMPILMITSIMMLIAANIAVYYSVTIFSTLVIAASLQLMIAAIVKIYYMKTM